MKGPLLIVGGIHHSVAAALLASERIGPVVFVQGIEEFQKPIQQRIENIASSIEPLPRCDCSEYLPPNGNWKAKNIQPFYMSVPKRRKRRKS